MNTNPEVYLRLKRANIVNTIHLLIAAYIVSLIILYGLTQAFPITPLFIDDFVVSKDGDIVLISDDAGRIYIYSNNLELKRSFRIYTSRGPILAIDNKDNIYVLRQNTIYRYNEDGKGGEVASEDIDLPRNWRLTDAGLLAHFIKPHKTDNLFATKRLRRVAQPGDIIFYASTAPYKRYEEFTDNAGNTYSCKSWLSGITKTNSKGERICTLKSPLYIRLFVIPFPAMIIVVAGIIILTFVRPVKFKP